MSQQFELYEAVKKEGKNVKCTLAAVTQYRRWAATRGGNLNEFFCLLMMWTNHKTLTIRKPSRKGCVMSVQL